MAVSLMFRGFGLFAPFEVIVVVKCIEEEDHRPYSVCVCVCEAQGFTRSGRFLVSFGLLLLCTSKLSDRSFNCDEC